MSRSYFDRDGEKGFTYYAIVETPWVEKVTRALAHAQGESYDEKG